MAIGTNAYPMVNSYVSVGREIGYGNYPTDASSFTAIEALTCGFKTDIETQKIDSLSFNRGMTRRLQLGKNVVGALEQNLHPIESPLLCYAGLGGALNSTELTTGVYQHEMFAGNFDKSVSSVSFNVRKGENFVWRYWGGRVNSIKISANVGEPVKVSYDFVFKDSEQLSDDISAGLSLSSYLPFTYANGTFAYSGSSEEITGFELTVSNNLKSDKDARSLGSRVLSCLPATRRSVDFKITQRFDTTTTYQRFLNAESAAVQLEFLGASLGSGYNNKLTIDMPKVYPNSPEPELSGAGEILSSEITYDVVVDNPLTSTGYDIKFTWVNPVASYF
jgi:Phage tail tube protein